MVRLITTEVFLSSPGMNELPVSLFVFFPIEPEMNKICKTKDMLYTTGFSLSTFGCYLPDLLGLCVHKKSKWRLCGVQ